MWLRAQRAPPYMVGLYVAGSPDNVAAALHLCHQYVLWRCNTAAEFRGRVVPKARSPVRSMWSLVICVCVRLTRNCLCFTVSVRRLGGGGCGMPRASTSSWCLGQYYISTCRDPDGFGSFRSEPAAAAGVGRTCASASAGRGAQSSSTPHGQHIRTGWGASRLDRVLGPR